MFVKQLPHTVSTSVEALKRLTGSPRRRKRGTNGKMNPSLLHTQPCSPPPSPPVVFEFPIISLYFIALERLMDASFRIINGTGSVILFLRNLTCYKSVDARVLLFFLFCFFRHKPA